jgi:hypothetical protein
MCAYNPLIRFAKIFSTSKPFLSFSDSTTCFYTGKNAMLLDIIELSDHATARRRFKLTSYSFLVSKNNWVSATMCCKHSPMVDSERSIFSENDLRSTASFLWGSAKTMIFQNMYIGKKGEKKMKRKNKLCHGDNTHIKPQLLVTNRSSHSASSIVGLDMAG